MFDGRSAHPLIADILSPGLKGREVPILLQKWLAYLVRSDSVSPMRFAMEAIDDGAAQSGSGTVFLFVSP